MDCRTRNCKIILNTSVESNVACKNKLLSTKSTRTRLTKELNASSSHSNENKLVTPRKAKATNVDDINSITPPKLKKHNEDYLKSPTTPSSLLKKLSINSPQSKLHENEKLEPKKLFEDKNIYQNARKALHSTAPVHLPGREEQLLDLKVFILQHCSTKESSTIYISGPPGTGKTASLSIILNDDEVCTKVQKIYINCTSIKSSVTIYSRIAKDLKIESRCKTEKDYIQAIEKHLMKKYKMILLVLDEIDQLESKKQSVLYTIFEWPSRPQFQIILIGIANALDLTDRILPRLQTRLELKPKLIHFSPYTKQQIITIFTERLKEAGVSHVFTPIALQMLAGKVAAISGDVRRALDIGRRVIELVEQNRKQDVLKSLENFEIDADVDGVKPLEEKAVELTQVVNVLNNIYGTTNNLNSEDDDSIPLQQKIILCTLLLVLTNSKNKDITIGKLHDVYKKVCTKQNILAVDQAEFAGLCSLLETRGIIRVCGKKEPRLHKVHLEWDQEEVTSVLKDKKLLSVILQDDFNLGRK
ncbi:cell division control protein 6-related [Holotrichia oblita]|uniref:Cell division control protein 6-related n=1 Tax=Holotrichia oblita TaxID=644536 RepID=A0ACB9TL65_HOLOL|nr:cell division control protein 6-related [Holotrichia oblita]